MSYDQTTADLLRDNAALRSENQRLQGEVEKMETILEHAAEFLYDIQQTCGASNFTDRYDWSGQARNILNAIDSAIHPPTPSEQREEKV